MFPTAKVLRRPTRTMAAVGAVMATLLVAAIISAGAMLRQQHALQRDTSHDFAWLNTRLETQWYQLELDLSDVAVSGVPSKGSEIALRSRVVASLLPASDSFPGRFAGPEMTGYQRQIEAVFAQVSPMLAGPVDAERARAALATMRSMNQVLSKLTSLSHLDQLKLLGRHNALIDRFERRRDAAVLLSVVCGFWLGFVIFRQGRRLAAAERANRQAQQRMRVALEAAGAGWWQREADGDFLGSEKACEILAIGDDDADRPGGFLENVHPDDRDAVRAAILAPRAGGEPELVRFRVVPPGKPVRWIVLIGRSVVGEERCLGAHGIIFDDTARHMLEEELRKSRDVAERAVAAKSRMLASASHDLRQPLQSMFMFAAALDREEDPARRREALGHLRTGMATLRSLLDGIVELARLESGSIKPQVEDFRLSTILEEVRGFYAPIAAVKGLALRVQPADDLFVRSDPVLLGRMIRNLVENALRYTESGGVSVSIQVRDGVAVVTVSDTGSGIPGEHIELIWEEFHQVGNRERKRSKGLGLGLSIVRNLATSLGHEIGVESRPGEGSSFRIAVALGEAVVTVQTAAAEIEAATRTVVIVDDDRLVLDGLDIALSLMGYEVVTGTSGLAAIEAVEAANKVGRVDFIVADYRLGPETGVEAIRNIRDAEGRPVPAVILTGDAEDGATEDGAANGIEVLSKPIAPEDLMRVIERIADAAVFA